MAALKGSISGDSFDLPLPDSLLHPLERMAPSGPWVFPHPNVWRDKARHWLWVEPQARAGPCEISLCHVDPSLLTCSDKSSAH